uniref:Uncharacterized protein n=1 Tax=mine drainage metagenome TaxID=410659 RepID=E6QAF9_9ZZZZ
MGSGIFAWFPKRRVNPSLVSGHPEWILQIMWFRQLLKPLNPLSNLVATIPSLQQHIDALDVTDRQYGAIIPHISCAILPVSDIWFVVCAICAI